jgi:type I restriction enzyme, S subunit
MKNERQHFYVLQWRELLRWDLKSARAAAFRAAHPSFRSLGEFIEESTEIVHPSRKPSHDWPVYGVSNRGGVTFSHYQLGEAFNSAYKRIRRDWFFHNPTRANVGSLGRVPDVPPDAITSPEYQVWKIKDHLLPEFVEILIRLPFFLDLVEYHRVGAVKERLFVENLREIPIPVLSESEQSVIIDLWRTAQDQITAAERRVQKQQASLERRFFADLQLEIPPRASMPKAFAVWWKDFMRWGVGFNYLNQTSADLSRGKYPVRELGDLLELLQYGTSDKASSSVTGIAMIRMNNIVDGDLNLQNMKYLQLSTDEAQELLVRDGDILFNRTNSKELVGKCAVFHAVGEYVFASYLIRIRADSSKADADFLAYVINSRIGREQIDALSRQIIGQANINSVELRGLRVPLPPLTVQKQMMSRVMAGRKEVAREREAVSRLKRETIEEVEALIFGA